MGVNPSTGFTQVRPTQDEIDAWHRQHCKATGDHRCRNHHPYRSACQRCGRRIWHSGIGVGSHRRACPGSFAERVSWFHWHHDAAEISAQVDKDPAAWQAYVAWIDASVLPESISVATCRKQVQAMIDSGAVEDWSK